MVLCLISLTRMVSRIGEQNQQRRWTLTNLIEENERPDDLSYYPLKAIQDSVGFSCCLELFQQESGHDASSDYPYVVAQVSTGSQ